MAKERKRSNTLNIPGMQQIDYSTGKVMEKGKRQQRQRKKAESRPKWEERQRRVAANSRVRAERKREKRRKKPLPQEKTPEEKEEADPGYYYGVFYCQGCKARRHFNEKDIKTPEGTRNVVFCTKCKWRMPDSMIKPDAARRED